MSTNAPRLTFINLPVQDLQRSIAFFTALGFEFDPRFTDENATCLILSQQSFVMLLTRPFFESFVDRPVADSHQTIGSIVALAVESRAEVDRLLAAARAAGATQVKDASEKDGMYGGGLYDLDGHHWEVFWMDPAQVQSA